MGFGTEWGWGTDKEESKKIFDTFANADGNFFDTANRYTEGTSEKFLGEFIASDRDHFVIATKYTLKDRNGDLNFSGNHRKNLMRSVRESLKRLNTDHIDVLWMHAWDSMTPTEEIMRGLDDLISRGLVHYVGVSDAPAWVVSQANTMAQLRGWSQFIGLQVEYSLIQRTVEFDLFTMAKAFGMTVTPWAPLAGGALTGKYLRGEKGRIKEGSKRLGERATMISKKVVEISERLGVTPAQVALNWTRQHRDQSIIPIIGATKVPHVEDMIGATRVILPVEVIQELNEVSKIEIPFPYSFFTEPTASDVIFSGAKEKLTDRRYL